MCSGAVCVVGGMCGCWRVVGGGRGGGMCGGRGIGVVDGERVDARRIARTRDCAAH